MTTTKMLSESVAEAPVKRGGRWSVVVAKPGQGSSGFYSEDMLKEFGPKAFPAGAKMFMDHDPGRSPKDMIGTYPDGAVWDDELKALVAEVEVFSHWQEFMQEVGPHCGVSIYMRGTDDKEGNITSLVEDRQNGADLVGYPGLAGSGLLELMESARARSSDEPGVASAQDTDWKDATSMDAEDKAALAGLVAAVQALVAEKDATGAQVAQVEADEALAEARVDAFEAAVESIEAADLTASQKRSIRAEAKKGTDVAPLIEAAKALKAEVVAEAAVQEPAGFVHESAGDKGPKLIEGWGL